MDMDVNEKLMNEAVRNYIQLQTRHPDSDLLRYVELLDLEVLVVNPAFRNQFERRYAPYNQDDPSSISFIGIFRKYSEALKSALG